MIQNEPESGEYEKSGEKSLKILLGKVGFFPI